MSKEILLDKKTYKLLEAEAKKDGLTVTQEIEVATLHFFKKHEPELFEKLKQEVDAAVLRVFEDTT